MRSRTPTIHCDAEDGFCGAWDVDYYEVSMVGDVKITREHPAPGWTSGANGDDFCPEHAPDPHPATVTP